MSSIVVVSMGGEAFFMSDDCMSQKVAGHYQRVPGSVPKIYVIGGKFVFGATGSGFAGTVLEALQWLQSVRWPSRLSLRLIVALLPFVLRFTWSWRGSFDENVEDDGIVLALAAYDRGKIRCFIFEQDKNFVSYDAFLKGPFITIGCFDDNMVTPFERRINRIMSGSAIDIRLRRDPAASVRAVMAELINALSAWEPEKIGKASFAATINEHGAR